jgi:hypothetical protein
VPDGVIDTEARDTVTTDDWLKNTRLAVLLDVHSSLSDEAEPRVTLPHGVWGLRLAPVFLQAVERRVEVVRSRVADHLLGEQSGEGRWRSRSQPTTERSAASRRGDRRQLTSSSILVGAGSRGSNVISASRTRPRRERLRRRSWPVRDTRTSRPRRATSTWRERRSGRRQSAWSGACGAKPVPKTSTKNQYQVGVPSSDQATTLEPACVQNRVTMRFVGLRSGAGVEPTEPWVTRPHRF